MEKFIENILQSEKSIHSADHLTYMTYPVVRDKKILLHILKEMNNSLVKNLNAILQYEYIFKRIKLKEDQKENFKVFEEKCAPRYNILPMEIEEIKKIFKLNNHYKNSPMVFMRNNKLIIMQEDSKYDELTLDKIKFFLNVSKSILKKTKEGIKKY